MATDGGTEDAGRSATIYQVAEAAGVSPSTVSRAFSRPGRVSDKTAARIHEIARELGYRTDAVFRAERPERGHAALVVERQRRNRLALAAHLRTDSILHACEHMLNP